MFGLLNVVHIKCQSVGHAFSRASADSRKFWMHAKHLKDHTLNAELHYFPFQHSSTAEPDIFAS